MEQVSIARRAARLICKHTTCAPGDIANDRLSSVRKAHDVVTIKLFAQLKHHVRDYEMQDRNTQYSNTAILLLAAKRV